MSEMEIGQVSDFFAHPVVAGIDLIGGLNVGDNIHIVGHSTDIEMVVVSMQVDRTDVSEASSGQSVGIKVPDRVWHGDKVYKVSR